MIRIKVVILLIFVVVSCKTQQVIPTRKLDMTEIGEANLEKDVMERAYAISKHHYDQFYSSAGLPSTDDSTGIMKDSYFIESVDNVINGLGFYFFIDKNLSTDYEFVVLKNYKTGELQQLSNLIEPNEEEYIDRALEFFFQKSINKLGLDKNASLKNLSDLWVACRWGMLNAVEIRDRDVDLIAKKLSIDDLSSEIFERNDLDEKAKTIDIVILVGRCRIYKYRFSLSPNNFSLNSSLMGTCKENIKM